MDKRSRGVCVSACGDCHAVGYLGRVSGGAVLLSGWTNAYVGTPYKDKGRTRENGVDCWGLVRLVYHDLLGVDLPSLGDGYSSASDRCAVARLVCGQKWAWEMLDSGTERPLDLVLLRIGDAECHVGIVAERGLMLHVLRGRNAVVERYGGPSWRNRVASLWRYCPRST